MANINIVTISDIHTPADWAEASAVLGKVLPKGEQDVIGTFALPSPQPASNAPQAVPTPQPISVPMNASDQAFNAAAVANGGYAFQGAPSAPVSVTPQQQANVPNPQVYANAAALQQQPAQQASGRKYNGKATDGWGKVGHKRVMFGDAEDCNCQPCKMLRSNPNPPTGQQYVDAANAELATYGRVLAQQAPATPQPATQMTPPQVANAAQRMDALVSQAMPNVTPSTPVTPPAQQANGQQAAKVYPPLPQLAQSLSYEQGMVLVEWQHRMVDPQKQAALDAYLKGAATSDILRSVADKKATMYETAQRKVAAAVK